MANEKPNCQKCRYRIWLAKMDCHVSRTDCDKYGTKLCENMNDPAFIKWMDERNGADNASESD